VTGVFSILAAPSVWAMTPIEYGGYVSYPFAGPELKTKATLAVMKSYPKLENYLKSNYQKDTYLLATLDAKMAAPIILDTGLPVMAMGGFNGSDPALTVEKLQTLVTNGQIRYFLMENRSYNNQKSTILNWIRKNCLVVPAYRCKDYN
jgi:4-amino-4-deoxy-L-arabinose transferase-like glycosyltransferase